MYHPWSSLTDGGLYEYDPYNTELYSLVYIYISQ